jgi:hypothetical protein
LAKDWSVQFPTGAPITTSVGSWTANANPEIRYFSGVATYSKTFNASGGWFAEGERLYLDLGHIGDVAEVRINGTLLGTAWAPPYRLDVTDHLRRGQNRLEIKVANTWQNRFVGDLQPGATQHAWTNAASGGGFAMLGKRLSASTALTPSGLLDPVRIIAVRDEAAR